MSNPLDLPRDVPVSISCYECDCDSPDSMEEALAAGWTEIIFTPDGIIENYLGYCPEHRPQDDDCDAASPDDWGQTFPLPQVLFKESGTTSLHLHGRSDSRNSERCLPSFTSRFSASPSV